MNFEFWIYLPDAKSANEGHIAKINCVLSSYFEDGRRWRNRSLQKVNEDFDIEPDAKSANKDNTAK